MRNNVEWRSFGPGFLLPATVDSYSDSTSETVKVHSEHCATVPQARHRAVPQRYVVLMRKRKHDASRTSGSGCGVGNARSGG